MEDYPLVYRCAIVVKPLQPFLDWLLKIESDSSQTLTELQQDSNIYLLPDFEQATNIEKAVDKYIKANYAGIFTHELSEWYLDPVLYPQDILSDFPGVVRNNNSHNGLRHRPGLHRKRINLISRTV